MAVAGGSETKGLELSLNKATNPLNNAEEWEEIQRFCSEVNKELEGPQYATRLLSHKIQSPQEWEAMQGLTVLEVCMRNCGARFHAEVGKYRFLNELIKVLSPKYLGARSTAKVKNKIVELMYSWTVGISNETKIQDAYKMLKRQGVIQQDPKLPDDNQGYFLPQPPPPRPSNPLFEDEEKSKLLSRLLKSGHPDDLDAANRLIKTMVKEDQTRMEKITKRIGALKSVEECTHTLSEMVARHRHVKATTEEFDSMKEVYKKCERLRPTLFKLASDTDDNDDALADILRANDGLTSVMEFYKSTVEGQTINGDVQQSVSGGGASLLDLEGLEVSSSVPIPSAIQLDTELMGLGLNDPLVGSPITEVFGSLENSAAQMSPATESEPSRVQIGSLAELEQIGRNMLQKSIPACTSPVTWSSPPIKLTLRELQSKGESHSPSHSTTLVSTPAMASPGKATADISLANVFVPLESIKPSSSLPVTAYDGHGLRVLLHFAREPPLGRSDVLVVVLSLLSTAPLPVQRLLFQAAVPKSMRVKLQPPSGTELPPFNPLVPPSAITQVMLLANPNKEKVRLRYKLTFLLGEESYSEVGEVDSFPVKCDEG